MDELDNAKPSGINYVSVKGDISDKTKIDELFEKFPENGPYSYCGGNPVKLVDMDGREKHILFDKNDVNRIKSAENIIDDPRIIGLHQHGSNLGILNGKDNETYTTPAELLNYLEKNSAKWQAHNRTEVENCINDEIIIDAEPIVLQFFSCNTGKGENSYAQQVSAAEGIENVLVIVADENVNTRIVNGVTYVNVLKKGNGEKPSNRETGSWRFFLNGKEILSKKLKFDETLKFDIKEIPFKQYKGLIPLHPCKAFNQK